jgi:hypothetical protein
MQTPSTLFESAKLRVQQSLDIGIFVAVEATVTIIMTIVSAATFSPANASSVIQKMGQHVHTKVQRDFWCVKRFRIGANGQMS